MQLPFLEYLGYYQVIEYYMAAFNRARTIKRVSNILKDPRFDHHDEVAVDRLIDVVLPGGRSQVKEAEQVLAAVEACLDDAAAARFLAERPAAPTPSRCTPSVPSPNACDTTFISSGLSPSTCSSPPASRPSGPDPGTWRDGRTGVSPLGKWGHCRAS